MGLTFLKLISPQGWAGLIVAAALSAMLAVQTLHERHWHHQADTNELAYQREHGAFLQTILNYSTAASQAQAADAANKARVEAEQAAINKQRDETYEARIADARARAERLRQQLDAARTNQGGSSGAPVSGLPASPSGPHSAAPEGGLSSDDALTATEQAIQLDELIKWVKGQHSVSPSGLQRTD